MDPNPYAAPESDVEPRRPGEGPHEDRLASRWKRLGGAILDGVAGFVLMFPILWFTGLLEPFVRAVESGEPFEPGFVVQMRWTFVGLVTYVVLHGWLLYTRGQTIGKLLVGTRIVRTDGSRCSLARIVGLRYLPVSLIGGVPVVGPLISFVGILLIFLPERRCLHDYLAETKVVDA